MLGLGLLLLAFLATILGVAKDVLGIKFRGIVAAVAIIVAFATLVLAGFELRRSTQATATADGRQLEISDQLTAARAEISNLTEGNARLNQQAGRLEEQNEELSRLVTVLTAGNAELLDQTEALEAQNSKLEEQITTLSGALDRGQLLDTCIRLFEPEKLLSDVFWSIQNDLDYIGSTFRYSRQLHQDYLNYTVRGEPDVKAYGVLGSTFRTLLNDEQTRVFRTKGFAAVLYNRSLVVRKIREMGCELQWDQRNRQGFSVVIQ